MRLERNNPSSAETSKNFSLNNLSTRNKVLIGVTGGCLAGLCAAYAMGYFSSSTTPDSSTTQDLQKIVAEEVKKIIAKELPNNDLAKTNSIQEVVSESAPSSVNIREILNPPTASNLVENLTEKNVNHLSSASNLISNVGCRLLVGASQLFLYGTTFLTGRGLYRSFIPG